MPNAEKLTEQIDTYRLKLFDRGDDPFKDFSIQKFVQSHAKIKDSGGNIVNLIHNKAQVTAHDAFESMREELGWIRYLVLKIRQLGISTYIQTRFFTICYVRAFITAYTLAHMWDSTEWIYGMSKLMHHELPSKMQQAKPLTSDEPTKSSIEFAMPHGSKMLIGTAGSLKLGHGTTIQLFHGSEIARWIRAEEIMKGLGNALHYVPGTEGYGETTAEGEDPWFFPNYKKAKEGSIPWRALFLGLKDFCFYSLPPEWKNRPKTYWRPDEIKFQIDHDVSDEIMDFVIGKKQSPDCNDSWPILNSQYPVNDKIAFSETGRTAFDLAALIAMEAEDMRQPIRKGDLEWDGEGLGAPVRLNEDVQLPLLEIYEEYDPDSDYIMTSDISEGVGANYHIADMWKIISAVRYRPAAKRPEVMLPRLDQVAHAYTNTMRTWDWGLFLFQLCVYYGWAYAGIECNNQGILVVQNFRSGFAGYPQTEAGYPYLYTPVKQESQEETPIDRLGWLTTKRTKEKYLVPESQKWVADRQFIFRCKRTIAEHRGFYWNAEKKEYIPRHKHSDAKEPTDDEVMAAGIAPQAFKEWKKRPRLLPRMKGCGI